MPRRRPPNFSTTAPSTLHYWLEGKTGRAGKVHRPVIRQIPSGTGAPVTWAEFVEAGLLRQHRRELKGGCLSTRSERGGIPAA